MNEKMSDIINSWNIYHAYYTKNNMKIVDPKLKEVMSFVKDNIPEEDLREIKASLNIS